MGMSTQRMTAIKKAAKGAPLPASYNDLEIPTFLRRPPPSKERRAQIAEECRRSLDPSKRQWAPIRKQGEWTERPTMPIMTKDPSLRVLVQVKEPGKAGSVLLREYADFAAFEKEHDFKTYPLKGTSVLNGVTVALVTAKPWAGREAKAPTEKKTRSKTDIIAALLLRPEGCVTSEVLEACNWPAVSMSAQARLAGLTLRKLKEGKITRYWGSK